MKTLHRISLASLCLLALLPFFSSCTKNATDVSDLVATVPSSASVVMGLNVTSILEKAGCKVDGQNITPSPELSVWVEKRGNGKPEASALKLFINGDSGIDPSGAILFMDAYNGYITAMLADTDKFIAFAEQQTGEKFQTADGDVKTSGNIAICGAQMWVCFTSRNTIDARAIHNYSDLDKTQSFSANGDVADEIMSMESDIVGWGSINALMKNSLATSAMLQYNMILGTLYEEPNSLSFKVDFEKGKLVASAIVLDTSGDKAKFLLPVEKIDLSTVESTATTAEAIFALTITKKLTEKIDNLSKSFGGNIFGAFTEALKTVDGTVCVSIGDLHSPDSNISGVVTTDGKDSPKLLDLLSTWGNTRRDGKLVRFGKGTVSGKLDVKEAAKNFKGAAFGCVLNASDPEMLGSDVVNTVAATLSPDGNGIRFNLTLLAANPSENILLSYLKGNKK